MTKLVKFLVEDSTVTIVEELPSKIITTFPAEQADRLERINGFIKKSCLKELESKINDLIKEYDLVKGNYSVSAYQKEEHMDLIFITIEKDLSRVSIEKVLIDTDIKEIYILETKLIKENKIDSLECFLNETFIKELLENEYSNEYRTKDYRVFKANFSHNFMNERSKELAKMTLIYSLSGVAKISFDYDNLPELKKKKDIFNSNYDSNFDIVLTIIIDNSKRSEDFKNQILGEKKLISFLDSVSWGIAIDFYEKEIVELQSLINKYVK